MQPEYTDEVVQRLASLSPTKGLDAYRALLPFSAAPRAALEKLLKDTHLAEAEALALSQQAPLAFEIETIVSYGERTH